MENDKSVVRKNRCWEVDFLRGLAILYVSIFHFCFIGVMITGRPIFSSILLNEFFDAIHYPIVFLLFFISGVSKAFTRNDLKRFLKIAICALIITIVTLIASMLDNSFSSIRIFFGVLHTIASCIIIYIFLSFIISKTRLNEKIADIILLLIGLIIIIVGSLWLYNVVQLSIPDFMILFLTSSKGYILSPGDFFAIFPMLGFYIWGVIFGKYVYKERKPLFSNNPPQFLRPINWLGKQSLWVYLAVPPLSMIILYFL